MLERCCCWYEVQRGCHLLFAPVEDQEADPSTSLRDDKGQVGTLHYDEHYSKSFHNRNLRLSPCRRVIYGGIAAKSFDERALRILGEWGVGVLVPLLNLSGETGRLGNACGSGEIGRRTRLRI